MTMFGKILLGLIILTGAVLLIKGPSKTQEVASDLDEVSDNTSVQESEDAQSEANSIFAGSFNDLMARGGEYKCTFVSNTEVGTSTGTVYIDGERIRGDFQSSVQITGQNIESSMINDGEFSYVWSSLMNTGFKVANSNDKTEGESVDTGFDYDQQLDYDCQSWNVDSSVFNLPEGVEFKEFPTGM